MIDLTGERFGRLLVIEKIGCIKKKGSVWKCLCDCGKTVEVLGTYLRRGDTKSCGCYHSDSVRRMMLTHGKSKTRLYRVWAGIKNRCNNPNSSNYKYYGAQNITMCEEWEKSFEVFEKWALDSGYDESAKPQVCTLDRIDNESGYSPDNCRWTDHTHQCNNQKSNRLFEYNGVIHTMAEWAKIFKMNYSTLRARIRKGMNFEDAINKPTRHTNN